MRRPPVSKQVRFEQDPYQGVPYHPGFAQGSEYRAAGNLRSGFSGPTVVPQPTPVLNALLTKLHEATISRNTTIAPRPTFQQEYGNRLQEQVAARGTLFNYTVPLYGDPMIEESFIQRDVDRRHADNLNALKTRYSIRINEETLNNLVLLAKTYSKTTYDDMVNIGLMMYRQEVINDLAERVAEANRQDNANNIDKSAPYKVEDPHLIALAYQSIVAEELRILPMQDVSNELVTNEAFTAVLACVIPPDRLEVFKNRLLGEVHEEESKQAKVEDFLKRQPFWNAYQEEYRRSAMLSWSAKYPRHL
jgi:hypothetical protein